MKTKKIIRQKLTMLIVLTSVIVASCGNSPGNTNSKNDSSTKPQVKVPQLNIHAAAYLGDLNAIKQHIKAGTDLNQKDEYGSTPLTIAATFGKTEAAKALIEGGADINLSNADGSTPLHVAAFFCRTEIVKALLQKGADKSLRNKYGSTAQESVSGPFQEVKGIYEQINKDLGPLGLKLDYDFLERTRPVIAELLHE